MRVHVTTGEKAIKNRLGNIRELFYRQSILQ